MKTLSIFSIALFCAFSTQLFPADSSKDIVGVWDTKKDNIKVEIYEKGSRFIGNPIDAEGDRKEDIEMLDLEYEGGKYVGKIFVKKRNRYFDVECEVKGDKLMLEVSAGMVTKDLEWTRSEK